MANREADIPCVPNEFCPEASSFYGCRTDTHHIYRWAEADTKTRKEFASLWINKLVLCRAIHTQLERESGWPDYPDVTEMQVAIDRFKGEYGTDRET